MKVKTDNYKRAYGFREFAQMFSISIDSTKRLWRTGKLGTICIGGRRLIPLREVERVEQQGIGNARQRTTQRKGTEEKQR